MEAILALERDVELAANARLDEVLLRLHLSTRPAVSSGWCGRHALAPELSHLGILIGRLKRRFDYDYEGVTSKVPSEVLFNQIEELGLRKKALSREFHSTPCTCQEM